MGSAPRWHDARERRLLHARAPGLERGRTLRGMVANQVVVLPLALLALLRGTVTIGPLTPVCRVGVPCSKPAASVVLSFTRGARAFRTTTRADGSYTLRLPPGVYRVTASAGMRISPAQITARSGGQRQAFSIDTGIR